ncbi:MAG: hypothetical protein PW792_14045 [Acidobacteriaceae bacterium]|nr:hypothetical protein [Acidobacteriaceae bacterium]
MLQVNYLAPADQTGYACAAGQYVRALSRMGVSVCFQPLLPGPGLGLWYECAATDMLPAGLREQCSATLFLDGISILHCVPEYYAPLTAWLRSRGVRGPIVGMTVWETTRIPQHWPALLQPLDALMAPSPWNVTLFRESGVSCPLFAVPHLSEFHGHAPQDACLQALRVRLPSSSNRFLFYNVGTWSARKGNDLLVQAFLRAFAAREDVALVLKTPATRTSAPGGRLRRAFCRIVPSPMDRARKLAEESPQILSIEEDWPSCEIAALHTLGGCYVSCTRGEGWGIGMYEAALYGKPVLAPNEGGHRAYLTAEAEYGLVESAWSRIPSRDRDGSYTADQQWVETDVETMAARMQACFANRIAFKAKAAAVARHLRETFSDESITASLIENLQETMRAQR